MKLQFGGVDIGTASNNVRFAWTTTSIKNEAGYVVALAGACEVVEGYLLVAGQADAKAKMDALFAESKTQRRDLKFLNDDNTDTTTVIATADTEGGVTWDRLTWTDAPGAQYATFRQFTAAWSWRVDLTDSWQKANLLMDWREKIDIAGGLPEFVIHRPVNRSTPVKQVTSTALVWTVVQTGHAVGYQHLPAANGPVLDIVHCKARSVTEVGGDRVGDALRNRRREWSYTFELAGTAAPVAAVTQWTQPFVNPAP